MSEDVLRGSVSWLLAVLAGDLPADEVEAGFAPCLSQGRDIGTGLARRFAHFRDVGPARAHDPPAKPFRYA